MKKIILLFTFLFILFNCVNAQCFKEIAIGEISTAAIKQNGSLWGWGWTILGDGSQINITKPTQIGTDTNWQSVTTGSGHSLAIKTDGTLWAWGDNSLGQLGDSTVISKAIPTQIGTSNDWKFVNAGGASSFAIKKNCTLWSWGLNDWGQLGLGTMVNVKVPTQIGTYTNWKMVSCGGYHALGLSTSGVLFSWGRNTEGQLGTSSYVLQLSPTNLIMMFYWASCSAGRYFSTALQIDGSLWTWGDNHEGQLGDGSTVTNPFLNKKVGANDWKSVKAGHAHVNAIKTDGTLWSWGHNNYGELGGGTSIIGAKKSPFQIGTNNNWESIVSKGNHGIAMKKNGSLWVWGSNSEGELGIGTTYTTNIPTLISCPVDREYANKISGSVFSPINSNCIHNNGEIGIPNILILTNPVGYNSLTDSNGRYSIYTDSGTYQLRPIYPQYIKPFLKQLYCPTNGSYNIVLNKLGKDTSGFNFAQEVPLSPILKIELSQTRLRRCFENTGVIKYCNIGMRDTDNVKITIILPDDVSYTASSKTPTINGKILTFNIGYLKAGECGTITLITKVDCINGLTRQTRCFKIAITPSNTTYKNLVNKIGYDKSKIKTDAICNLNTSIKFTITNEGENMSDSSTYRIYKDALLCFKGKFKLTSSQSQVISIHATGHTYRIEADQTSLYPTYSNPTSSIENCGSGGTSHLGNITKLPPYEENFEYKEVCVVITDSYDPNDKYAIPSGVGIGNIVKHKVPINYTINFQNTGNDTAYTVIISDTLSKHLDLSTLMIGGASHSFKTVFKGENAKVINFVFDNIFLTDSTTNEKKSHGFINYRIMPYDTIQDGTIINNTADIYFDFNPPVRTNTVIHTIDDRMPSDTFPIMVTGIVIQQNKLANYTLTPNPAKDKLRITGYDLRNGTKFSVYNSIGQAILEDTLKENETNVNINSLGTGIYFMNINGAVKKFVVQ